MKKNKRNPENENLFNPYTPRSMNTPDYLFRTWMCGKEFEKNGVAYKIKEGTVMFDKAGEIQPAIPFTDLHETKSYTMTETDFFNKIKL